MREGVFVGTLACAAAFSPAAVAFDVFELVGTAAFAPAIPSPADVAVFRALVLDALLFAPAIEPVGSTAFVDAFPEAAFADVVLPALEFAAPPFEVPLLQSGMLITSPTLSTSGFLS